MGPRANLFKSQKKTQKEVEISLYVFLASLKLRSVVFMGRKLGRQFLCIQTKMEGRSFFHNWLSSFKITSAFCRAKKKKKLSWPAFAPIVLRALLLTQLPTKLSE